MGGREEGKSRKSREDRKKGREGEKKARGGRKGREAKNMAERDFSKFSNSPRFVKIKCKKVKLVFKSVHMFGHVIEAAEVITSCPRGHKSDKSGKVIRTLIPGDYREVTVITRTVRQSSLCSNSSGVVQLKPHNHVSR